MKIVYTFRHMESSKAMEGFVESKLPKVARLLEKEIEPVVLEVRLDAAREHHHHRVEMHLKSHHYDIHAHHEGPELYEQIEIVVDKLASEISKLKDKRIDAIKHREKGSF